MNAMILTSTNAYRCVHVFQHDRHSMHPQTSIRQPVRIDAWFGQRTLQPPGLKEQLAFPRRYTARKPIRLHSCVMQLGHCTLLWCSSTSLPDIGASQWLEARKVEVSSCCTYLGPPVGAFQ